MATARAGTEISFRPPWSRRAWKWPRETTPPAKWRWCRHAVMLSLATVIAAAAGVCGVGGTAQAAPKLKVLYSFTTIRGEQPLGGLAADGAGNLYGTTFFGGSDNHGAVFEMTPPVPGKTAWTEKVIHSFHGRTHGAFPVGSLIADGAGNLYCVATAGGYVCSRGSCGLVYELSRPPRQNTWAETVLHYFRGSDGFFPSGGLFADRAGNLYGTTQEGGAHNIGVAYELSPPAAGGTTWTDTVIYSFDEPKGYDPVGPLVADNEGNLYGATKFGGAHSGCAAGGSGCGVVFRLSPPAGGGASWTEKVLHYFDVAHGGNPAAGLIADAAGNLYGTTMYGGREQDCPARCGVVFELSPPAAGETTWAEKVLHSFGGRDGFWPFAGLIADGAGNLFGTTYAGGLDSEGVVFELSPTAGRTAWTETFHVPFSGANGARPQAGLVADGAGNLYGTTVLGGAHGEGVVFTLTP